MTWQGPPGLEPMLRPVGELRTHPENPRRGDIATIRASLVAFGQLKPIIVYTLDGLPTIFAGNHTYRAAVEEGWTHIAVTEPSYMSEQEAEAYLYMDNAASDHSTYDYAELQAILEERAQAGTLDRTGFTADDLKAMRDEAAQLAQATLREQEFQRARDADEDDGPEPEPTPQAPTPPLRQMLLTWRDEATFDAWARKMQTLRRELGTEDVSSTVRAIIDRAVELERGK